MKNSQDFNFEIEQKVLIIELQWKGIIKAIYFSEKGTQYLVRYFMNGDPKEVYFYSYELEETK